MPDGDQYDPANWTGISGDRFRKNAPGADFTTFTDEWVNTEHPRQRPAWQAVSVSLLHSRRRHAVVSRPDRQRPRQRHEPDLRRVGRSLRLAPVLRRAPPELDAGRRLLSRQGQFERHGDWSRREAVHLGPGHRWRWRTAFQHDFAARMDWTIRDVAHANHNPEVVVNGRAGKVRLRRRRPVRRSTLDAAGSRDPDGNTLTYTWFVYPEAGTGIPGTRWSRVRRCRLAAAAAPRPEGFRPRRAVARPSRRRAAPNGEHGFGDDLPAPGSPPTATLRRRR